MFSLQKTVYVRMVFIRMDNVETLKEQFDGDVYFRARWREPKLDNLKVQPAKFFSTDFKAL